MERPEGLNHRRFLFCLEYIKDYNGTRAYKDAGYSENGAQESASKLLSLPIIQDTIAELEQDRLDAARVTGEKIIKRLDRLASKAEIDGDTTNAIRANEILGRGKLWDRGGGIKKIESKTDGTMTIKFDEGE